MEFLKNNQFKIAAIIVSMLIICIVALFVDSKENNKNTNLIYYTINFDSVGGGDYVSQTVLVDGKVTEPIYPVKEGYIFLGWYVGSDKFDFNDYVNKNLTLVAKWEKIGGEDESLDLENEVEIEDEIVEDNNSSNSNLSNNTTNNNNKPVKNDKVSVTDITLNKTSLTLDVGQSDTLTVTIKPDSATNKNVSWSSSNTNVVTISDGEVKAVGEGNAVITVSVDGKSVICNVKVNKKVTYEYQWEMIGNSSVGEYYLYIVNSEGKKVNGMVKITYVGGKSREQFIEPDGFKIIKNTVLSVEIISVN